MKSKLNGRSLVQGVNTWAVSLLGYSAAFISWKSLLQAIDTKTRKLLPLYGGLHPKSDRLYIPRKDRGRGLIATEDYVKLAVRC